jgi:hypothetical protein
MKRKPIKIDWEELESAFDSQQEDLVYYLDLVTGQVILEGEGEENDFEDDENGLDSGLDTPVATRKETSSRLYVEPPDDEDEVTWMEGFADEIEGADAALAELLRTALDGDDPVDGFRDALRARADHRDRWFAYRADRLHEIIEGWLTEHEVAMVDRPPWG